MTPNASTERDCFRELPKFDLLPRDQLRLRLAFRVQLEYFRVLRRNLALSLHKRTLEGDASSQLSLKFLNLCGELLNAEFLLGKSGLKLILQGSQAVDLFGLLRTLLFCCLLLVC